jgi:hypothetical protein
VSGGRESRLGACPSRAELIAWLQGALQDWDVGEHILSCPACQTDRAAWEVGELDDDEPARPPPSAAAARRGDDDDDDDDDDRGASSTRMPPDPAPGTIWILRRPRGTPATTPFTWVLVVDREGDTAVTNLLLPADEYRDGDTLIEHEDLDLVAPAGIVERISISALAAQDGAVDASTVNAVRDAVHVEAEEEHVAAARTWHAVRFAADVRPFQPPPPEQELGDAVDAQVGEVSWPITWSTTARTPMGSGAGTRGPQTFIATLPVAMLEQAGWCEPELTIALERTSGAATASGRVRAHRRRGGPGTGPAIQVTLRVTGASWDSGGPVATLSPTSLQARFTLPATTTAVQVSVELISA